MREMGNAIMRKWDKLTEANDGCFIRHIDGNHWNAEPSNQVFVHPFDAFAALFHRLDWVVDWETGLTEEEVAFVRENVWNFCVTYQAHGRTPAEPPIDRENPPEDRSGIIDGGARGGDAGQPDVRALIEQGDAAMAEGEFDEAVALYESAKELRSNLLADAPKVGTPPFPMEAAGRAAVRTPLHGRRSGSRGLAPGAGGTPARSSSSAGMGAAVGAGRRREAQATGPTWR